MANVNREQLYNLPLTSFVLTAVTGLDDLLPSTGDLDVATMMEYFGKIQLLKPVNEDGHPVQLSAQFYTDEALTQKVFGLNDFDTAKPEARQTAYAFVGGNSNEASWIRLDAQRFEDGVGPEYDNFPFVIDMAAYIQSQGTTFSAVLGSRKKVYIKYSWYWYGQALNENDVAVGNPTYHYSDEYSLVFPNISEVANSGGTGGSGGSSQQNNCIPLSGGVGIGSLELIDDLKIVSSDYVQTTDVEGIRNYSGDNAFIQAMSADLYGPAVAGSLGYCIVRVVLSGDENGFQLSGDDMSKLVALTSNNWAACGIDYNIEKSRSLSNIVLNNSNALSNARFSYALEDRSGSMCFTVKSIDVDKNIVFFNEKFEDNESTSALTSFVNKSQADLITLFETDDNGFYVPGFPEIGNITLKNFVTQHVEGGAVRAIGKYTHAEGRDNIADARYSHVEGSHNIAGDMASHAEGFVNVAQGRYSHAEGNCTSAIGQASHTQGYCTVATGKCATACGNAASAEGSWSFANGKSAYTGPESFSGAAIGGQVSAIATNTFACGAYALAANSRSFVWNGSNNPNNIYTTSADGSFNINPENGISGFYIGGKTLHDYLSDISSQQSEVQPAPSETVINNNNNTFITHQLENGFIYNDGKTFEESPSAAVFVTAGGGTWGFYNGTGKNRFEGKFIKVKPGDIITYQKKPYPVQISANPTTDDTKPDGAIDYYTTYIRALSVHDFSEITTAAMQNSSRAPLDNSTLTSTDPAVLSSWEGRNGSHQFYRQNALFLSGKWAADYVNSTEPTSWNVVRQQVKSDTNNNVEYLNYAFEVQVKVPENTYLLYVCTKYYNTDQSLISFKINGYELVKDANNVEMSLTENSFNCNSATNQLYSSLTCFNKYGYGISHNGNYLLTHYIPCKYGDQILLSMTCPYYLTATSRYIYGRSIEYFDENFNRIAGSSESNINNGFDANQPLNSDSLDRKCVQLVSPVSVKGCKYVRIGIPVGSTPNTYKDTIIQIIPLDKYPTYTVKEPNNFIAFQKNWSQTTDSQQNMTYFEGKQLLFFGDSITRNSITGNDRPTGSQYHSQYEATTKGYVHYLSESLHSYYVNAANGGDTAALSSTSRGSLASKIANWQNEQTYSSISAKMNNSDAVFVMIGTNDWAYSWTPFGDVADTTNTSNDNFCGAIRSICNNLHQKFAGKAPIVFLTPIKRVQQSNIIDYTEANSNGKYLSDYCNAIKTICNEYDGIYVIDLYNICKIDPGRKNSLVNAKYIPDGTHPSSLGHKVIAQCILKKLPEIMSNFYSKIDDVEKMIEV